MPQPIAASVRANDGIELWKRLHDLRREVEGMTLNHSHPDLPTPDARMLVEIAAAGRAVENAVLNFTAELELYLTHLGVDPETDRRLLGGEEEALREELRR